MGKGRNLKGCEFPHFHIPTISVYIEHVFHTSAKMIKNSQGFILYWLILEKF